MRLTDSRERVPVGVCAGVFCASAVFVLGLRLREVADAAHLWVVDVGERVELVVVPAGGEAVVFAFDEFADLLVDRAVDVLLVQGAREPYAAILEVGHEGSDAVLLRGAVVEGDDREVPAFAVLDVLDVGYVAHGSDLLEECHGRLELRVALYAEQLVGSFGQR